MIAESTWPNVLQRAMQRVWPNANLTVRNLAVGGTTAAFAALCYRRLATENVDLLLVEYSFTTQQTVHMQMLFNVARAYGAAIMVVDYTSPVKVPLAYEVLCRSKKSSQALALEPQLTRYINASATGGLPRFSSTQERKCRRTLGRFLKPLPTLANYDPVPFLDLCIKNRVPMVSNRVLVTLLNNAYLTTSPAAKDWTARQLEGLVANDGYHAGWSGHHFLAQIVLHALTATMKSMRAGVGSIRAPGRPLALRQNWAASLR